MPIFSNWHSFFGIIPLKWLPLNRSTLKLESLSISSGMLPKNLLSLMSNVKRDNELRTTFGNDIPVRLFPRKIRCFTFCRFKQEGNNLESKLWERFIISNEPSPHGSWPSKKLLLRSIIPENVTVLFPIHKGIIPDMWLLLISRIQKLKGAFGRVPVKWLLFNSNKKKDWLKFFEKNSPWKLLLDNLKIISEVQLATNSIGTHPEKLLKVKSNLFKLLMSPMEDGRLPSKLFWDKFRYSKFVITLPIFSWSCPSKWLPETSNQVRLLQLSGGKWNWPSK